MSAEDWLRERGIEITRRGGESQPGQYARYPTSALPGPPPGADIEDQETQAVPSIVRLDLHIVGDITEWPTGKLEDDAPQTEKIPEVDSPIGDARAGQRDEPDFALADEATVIMPSVSLPDITTTPTRRLVDAEGE
ncbi:MAG: hypothetical protein H0X24_06975 [Ktedonobacterales bacterium]|nr:hypothetical protein [Ktedonobacterales bacterium]